MTLPRLLILSFTDARRDPRVFRQAALLRERFAVTVAGLGDPGLDGIAFLPVRRRPKSVFSQAGIAANLLVGNDGPAQRRFVLNAPLGNVAGRFDLVLVNDAEPLPLGFALANGAPVVFDAHEYYPKEFEHSRRWRLFFRRYMTRLCAEYIPRCACMTTVCAGIAEEYRKNFNILPEIIYNAPEYCDLPVNAVSPERIRLIHHGAANADRGIERMIEVMDYTAGRFSLDLYLVGEDAYIHKLAATAAARNNVTLCRPVPMRDLVSVSNRYDMGLFLVQPATFNLLYCLPNKFFEFMQARIGIAIGPSPEMAGLVKQHKLGVIAGDFTPQSTAAALNALTAEDITAFKCNAANAAGRYTAERSMEILADVLLNALSRHQGRATQARTLHN
jgi:hypothetical protein